MKIYIAVGICAAVFFAYLMGGRIARERCRADNAVAVTVTNADAIQIKRRINEKVFNTSVGDIRDQLREKYTITD